ncbi:glutathione S-transferase family protein [uncultured Brevundimonas sp.]|uniref:glutathione S-transferase family protein n=1 Tax=uncultured Brevundimonas sp. TaxID=213418 RepID=UPI0026015B39|nr:glutathione S-transferase family protein [uncultured Brevundimonas sp.]
MKIYAHPFSSYCQKALIALYENDTPFAFRLLEGEAAFAELKTLWPVGKFPVLLDGDRTVVEATAIIEHLAVHHPGPVRLIPADPAAAVEVRMMDRVFDHYVSSSQQKLVADALRPEGDRDPYGVAEAKRMLDTAYAWLDERLAGREWATDHGFNLADCAAAPALFYADWSHPIEDRFATLKAYRARLLARPSMARAVDEARPYRAYFPLGAPDRD